MTLEATFCPEHNDTTAVSSAELDYAATCMGMRIKRELELRESMWAEWEKNWSRELASTYGRLPTGRRLCAALRHALHVLVERGTSGNALIKFDAGARSEVARVQCARPPKHLHQLS